MDLDFSAKERAEEILVDVIRTQIVFKASRLDEASLAVEWNLGALQHLDIDQKEKLGEETLGH